MIKIRLHWLYLLLFFLPLAPQAQTASAPATARTAAVVWTPAKANAWYRNQPWLVGANYVPANAINQLEMWQAETFDTAQIAKEFAWARSIGMNTMRVFLHDLLYQQDAEGFLQRIDQFLSIAKRYNIRILLVLFDSVWDPFPKLGRQRDPKPHVHNSGWVQNPGYEALKDETQHPRLEAYVKAVVGRFRNDDRVWGWDVWNEPDNPNTTAYGKVELPDKLQYVLKLLPQVFAWTRAAGPVQPVTSAPWWGNWSHNDSLQLIQRIQFDSSDVITFHNYDGEQEFEKRVGWLQRYNRPVICTEYMSRGNNSTFHGVLPIAKKYKVGAINWGLVSGKSQTIYPWDSWERPYRAEPALWFHDVFRADGTPYRQYEVDYIRALTGVKK
ncbi:MAG TPA: cellulase family glycosylhydrolase [Chitinophagaceae bacterium]|jgi:hypothetical protein|nr:cellulase family glycosylhydrolase [Chitinophagaceae bacterium]